MLWNEIKDVFLRSYEKVVEKFDKLSLVTFVGCCHMCLNSLTVVILFFHDDDDDDHHHDDHEDDGDDDDGNLIDDHGHLTGHSSVWIK